MREVSLCKQVVVPGNEERNDRYFMKRPPSGHRAIREARREKGEDLIGKLTRSRVQASDYFNLMRVLRPRTSRFGVDRPAELPRDGQVESEQRQGLFPPFPQSPSE